MAVLVVARMVGAYQEEGGLGVGSCPRVEPGYPRDSDQQRDCEEELSELGEEGTRLGAV